MRTDDAGELRIEARRGAWQAIPAP
jgi:hypothetical protein